MLGYIILASTVALVGYILNVMVFSGGKCQSKNRIDGKIVVITGANSGIGYETALDLARRGGTIIMACRNLNKANTAASKIIAESNNRNVFVEKLDLASLKSIKEFVDTFTSKYQRLDILINNAGIGGKFKGRRTEDGFGLEFGVMHLGHFYLTCLLLDVIKKSAPSRILNVSSMAHKWGKIDFEDLDCTDDYDGFSAYNASKLAIILFTLELSKRLEGTGVTTVSLHPGAVRTEIYTELKTGFKWTTVAYYLVFPFWYLITKNTKQGAQTSIHCAVDEEIPDQNGAYFVDCKLARPSKRAQNEQLAKKLWIVCEKMVGIDKKP